MNRKELTKTVMMISNQINPLVSMVYITNFSALMVNPLHAKLSYLIFYPPEVVGHYRNLQ